MHNLYRVLKTVITVMLTVTSSSKNSQNKWLLVMLLTHGDDDDDVIMMFNDSIDSSIRSCALIWELKHNMILINVKILTY
jgi:hypothetical protein